MSPIEVLQLVGYSTGATLHFWLAAALWRRRLALSATDRTLLCLAICIGVWHASSLVSSLHQSLGLDASRWILFLRFTDTLGVIGITIAYSLLLHLHLHFWASAHSRGLRPFEKARAALSYVPLLFLVPVVYHVWTGTYQPMLVKLAHVPVPLTEHTSYVFAFSLWAANVLCVAAITDVLIARRSESVSERQLLRTLAASFTAIGLLFIAVYAFGFGAGTNLEPYLKTILNLASLLPTGLIAFHIYRYRYLEVMIKDSLVLASFAAIVMTVYLLVIRSAGGWLTEHYGLRSGAIESLLILALALCAAPLRSWLDRRFHRLLAREAALYREVVTRIGSQARRFRDLFALLRFVEEKTASELGLRRVVVVLPREITSIASDNEEAPSQSPLAHALSPRATGPELESTLYGLFPQADDRSIQNHPLLRELGFDAAFCLRREDRINGFVLIDAARAVVAPDCMAVLEVLSGQIALAIDESRLIEENVQLERRVAERERLAALGNMAATVAHEVKNPLSAIKSIAQVMREDEQVCGEYSRDLNLIAGEVDRLSRSVTQLLTFSRGAEADHGRSIVDNVVHSVFDLFHADARRRGITMELVAGADCCILGDASAALRDALGNLLLNSLQATPPGGAVKVITRVDLNHALIRVSDNGTGIAPHVRSRIWEPFFTTRQRGTGLGLAIVKKRIEEVGGEVTLSPEHRGGGTTFELRLPIPPGAAVGGNASAQLQHAENEPNYPFDKGRNIECPRSA